MAGCQECREGPIDPLIGREPWRQARLTDATGPTGPTGVVHDMRSATGPFSAVVESNLCACSVPGIVAKATWGFTAVGTNFIGNSSGLTYLDGVLTVATLAADDLSGGAWIKAEVVPRLLVPHDTVTRGPLPFVLTSETAVQTPEFSESSEYVYAEHGMRFEVPRGSFFSGTDSLNYQTAAPFKVGGVEYYSGPIRITAGYGTTTVHDVYSLSPAIWVPSVRVPGQNVTLALLPYDVEPSEKTRISALAAVGAGGAWEGRSVFSFPIQLPQEFVLGGGQERSSTASLHSGIKLDYDPARMDEQTLVNQQLLRGPTIGVAQRNVIEDGRTDVVVPVNATGPTGQALPVTESAVYNGAFGFGDQDYLSRAASAYTIPINNRFFSRGFGNARFGNRPDLHDFPQCHALNGPTWHERNIVRFGSHLGVDGARHKLSVKFDWSPPSTDDYVSFFNRLWTVPATWSVTANVAFLLLGGSELQLIPAVQGRNLMPGLYAVGATEMTAVELSQISGINQTLGNVGGFTQTIDTPATASVDMEILPIVHAYGNSDVIAIGPPANAPPAYTELPTPGQDGMTLDGYTMWLPTVQPGWIPTSIAGFWPLARPIAGARISVRLQAWFKITMTSVDLVPAWSGNRVVYRRLATPEIFLDLSDEQCNALSAGDEISVSSVALQGTNSRVDPYKLQLSIYEPD
jgi:hypothetical protein